MIKEEKLIRFDWAIKSMLRNKANYDILEGFLSSLLKDDIKVLNILESESNSEEGQKFKEYMDKNGECRFLNKKIRADWSGEYGRQFNEGRVG